MTSSILSVVVAALAIIVGAIMQYATLKLTRRNTVSNLKVGIVESKISKLQEALSTYIPLTNDVLEASTARETLVARLDDWSVEDEKKTEIRPKLATLGEKLEMLRKEEARLLTLIELNLDIAQESHRKLLGSIMVLRSHNWGDTPVWLDKRAAVIAYANQVIADQRNEAFGFGNPGHAPHSAILPYPRSRRG